jgi:soluble cytochrome b562
MKPRVAALIAAGLLVATIPGLASEEDASPVDLLMEQISRDLKKLSRQFDNAASRESSLALARAMIKANDEAKVLEPISVGRRTGAERTNYLARYREGMDELGRVLTSLLSALEADDATAAETLIDEAYALRKKFHDELL